MKLNVQRADPAGNITLFVHTPVDPSQRAALGEKLMAIPEFKAEQVGYLCENSMEMAGGEFCGNATRAYGMLTALQKGMSGKCHLTLSVSGCARQVGVDVDLDAHTARSEMPLPKFVRKETVDGAQGMLVHLGGIAHFVVSGTEPTEAFFKKAEATVFAAMPDLDAYGVVFLDRKTHQMRPLVKAIAVNSLFWEGSCGSGTLAAMIAECEGKPDGAYTQTFFQPAGEVEATVVRKDGKIARACIGGSVTLDAPVEIEV